MTPCNFPKFGSKLYHIARYFSSASPRYVGGRVPIQPLLDSGRNITLSDVYAAIPRLRNQFYYYIAPDPNNVTYAFCGEWPQFTYEQTWDEKGVALPYKKVHADPRLSEPLKQPRKFRIPASGTILSDVAKYLLRHRSPVTHWCDCTNLYARYVSGAQKVIKRIYILNQPAYGWNIRKPISGLNDNMWIVDRQRNVKLFDKPSLEKSEAIELNEEEWEKMYGDR